MKTIKYIFKFLICSVTLFVNIFSIQAQSCAGNWVTNDPFDLECVVPGQLIGRFNPGNPTGCPTNPSYVATQTNTFIFNNAVSGFTIDFNSFSGPDCARIEVKINGIFYHLTTANFIDFPPGSNCTGSFNLMMVTQDGYLTGIPNIGVMQNGQGRIILDAINATSVTISTNDGAGSIFGIPYNCVSIIPLKLKSFTGIESDNCQAIVTLQTGTESNIKNFELLQSADAIVFKKVADILPKGSESRYTIQTGISGDAFFKLKINDLDGHYEYSQTIKVNSNCDGTSYEVVPNPAQNIIEIQGLEISDRVSVMNILGKTVLNFNSLPGNGRYEIGKLSSGMYWVRITNGNAMKANLKFVKN